MSQSFGRGAFDDAAKDTFVDSVAIMLKAQVAASGRTSVDHADGTLNPRALGYIYGFVDAALRTIGQDMADIAIGMPITFQILRRLFPGDEQRYLDFVRSSLPNDTDMTGILQGGQQYLDFNRGQLAVPMGLARIVLESA
jgi:hypothetical protein